MAEGALYEGKNRRGKNNCNKIIFNYPTLVSKDTIAYYTVWFTLSLKDYNPKYNQQILHGRDVRAKNRDSSYALAL